MKQSILEMLLAAGIAWGTCSSLVAQTQQTPAQQPAVGQPAEVDARRAERDQLWEQAKRLKGERKFLEAVQTGERMLAIERDWLGPDHKEIVVSIDWLAGVCELAENWEAAEARRQAALDWRTKQQGVDWWETTDARLALEHVRLRRRLTPEERTQLREADTLGTQVVDKLAKADYAVAVELALQVIEIRRALLGEQHPDYVTSLNNLGLLYQSMGDPVRAEPLLQQALAVRKSVLGEQHPDYARSLNNLGLLYKSMGDPARAEPLYQQALAIRKTVLGEQHLHYAQSLNNLGLLYQSMGDLARAEPLYQQASNLWKEILGEQHPEYATSLNNLGLLYSDMGDPVRAEPLLQQALAIRKSVLGEQHPDYALSLSNLGTLHYALGDPARAEPLFRQASQICKETLGEQHPDYALSLNNLGLLYQSMGDPARAEPLLQQASEIWKVVLGEQHPDYATSLNNLGLLYQSMGDPARAEPLLQQALAIRKSVLGEQHPDYARSLSNLGSLHYALGDPARAEPLFRQASQICKETLGEQHPDYATSLNNLGMVFKDMGDPARAERFLQQASEIWKVVLGEQHPSYATSLNNLGLLYQSMGDPARAEPLLQQALAIRKAVLGQQHPAYATSLNILGTLHYDIGDPARAEPLFQQAVEITAAHLERSAAILTEQQQLKMAGDLLYRLENYVSTVAALDDRDAAAFEAVLRWKGAVTVRQRGIRLVADEPAVAPLFTELQSVTRRWAALAQQAPAPDQQAQWKSQLETLTAQKDRLEADLSRQSAVYRQATTPVTVPQLQAALPAGTVLIDYFELNLSTPADEPGTFDSERSLLAFVLRAGENQPVTMFHLGPVAPIAAAVDTWRKSFGLSAESLAAGRQLRDALWQPLLESLEGAETVLVSPDGVLGRLPFAALPGRTDGTYLLEDHRLALVPVPRLIPALMNEADRRELPRDLLLIGDVDYERREVDAVKEPRRPRSRFGERSAEVVEVTRGSTWSRLEGAAAEVAFIKDLYTRLYDPPPEKIIDRRQTLATEEAFREYAPQCYLLHVATHGFFAAADKQSALSGALIAEAGKRAEQGNLFGDRHQTVKGYSPNLLSGLVLAGANQPPELPSDPQAASRSDDDGYLSASEIAFLPLNGVRLVVLSACETGLGEVAGGEGLLGIQRAFQISGARTTIASLWKVNDATTRRLMEEFYRNYLQQEQSPLDALRNAQLWALRNPTLVPRGATAPIDETTETQLPPYYWAAFTLSGEWR